MASLLNMSGGSLLKKGLPYDAEIEYLESSGTQYIDTDIRNYWLDSLEVSITFSITSFNVATSFLSEYAIFGAKIKTDKYSPTIFGGRTSNRSSSLNRWCGENTTFNIATIETDLLYNVKVVYKTADKGNVTLNGITKEGGVNNKANKKEGNMCFFSDGTGSYAYSMAKIYACSIKKDDILVRDFIPVRAGTTGYLYDKISGQLFGNAGTGSFILGADKH